MELVIKGVQILKQEHQVIQAHNFQMYRRVRDSKASSFSPTNVCDINNEQQ